MAAMAQNSKIAIEEIEKMKELRIKKDGSNVIIPDVLRIQRIRATARRNAQGEIISGSIDHLTITGIDDVKAKAIEGLHIAGLSAKTMKPLTVELEGLDETKMQEIAEKSEIFVASKFALDISNAELALLWVNNRDSGSYNGLKLVINVFQPAKQGQPTSQGVKQ